MPLPIVQEELPDEDYRASLWLGRNKGDGTLRHHKLFRDATGRYNQFTRTRYISASYVLSLGTLI